jgi:signal transduction histidine kinase
MSALYAWLRRHPVLVDSVLAALLGLFALGRISGQPWPNIPITLLMVVPVAFRRRIPLSAFACCVLSALWQLGANAPNPADAAVLVMIYTVAAYRPRRDSLTVLTITLIGSGVAVEAWSQFRGVADLLQRLFLASVMFGGTSVFAWILGDSMRYRRGYYAALEDRAARLEAERDAQAKIATAAERARIARELHDVIAHHVSVMVVQADGAGYALRSSPETTATALRAISDTGRQALNEMRRLLGVLRSEGDQAQLAPMPGLSELRELLDQARSAGLAVTYTLTGTPRELPEGAELAAYRVVQESLTNTRKHAGLAASATVTLRYQSAGLTVEVTDDGFASPPADTTGHGLAGMRERIAMYGGTVEAGPLAGGGFGVRAHLPCPQADGSPAGPGAAPPAPDAPLQPATAPASSPTLAAGWTGGA